MKSEFEQIDEKFKQIDERIQHILEKLCAAERKIKIIINKLS